MQDVIFIVDSVNSYFKINKIKKNINYWCLFEKKRNFLPHNRLFEILKRK